MNIQNGVICYYNNPVDPCIIAYSINACGCLYLTSNGNTHYIPNPGSHLSPIRTSDDFVNRPGALDVYLLGSYISGISGYAFIFQDRIESYIIGCDNANVIELRIRPDFQVFPVPHSNYLFHYINDGTLYRSDGLYIMDIPEYKFVWDLFYDAFSACKDSAYKVYYVDHDDKPKSLGRTSTSAPKNIEKVSSTADYDVYRASNYFVLYHHGTRRAHKVFHHHLIDYQIETNGYQLTLSNDTMKYYCNDDIYFEIPIDAKLCWPGHRTFTAVPTKSARF